MSTFLYECAEKIKNRYADRYEQICLIVPNQRTKIYLNLAMSKLHQGPVWGIKTLGMGDIAKQITQLRPEDKETLIFTLYDIFIKYFKHRENNTYDPEQFYSLGEVLLNDFNEIDNWLVNPEEIFRNIKNIKEIDSLYDHLTEAQKKTLREFSLIFSDDNTSKEKEKLLHIWNIIPKLYADFRHQLLKQKVAYNGLIMREMTNAIESEKAVFPKYEKFIFIGFNALTKAEMSLPKFLIKQGKAEYFQDSDAYYHFDKKQEAGFFLRKNSKELNLDCSQIKQRIPTKDTKTDKTISVYGVPKNIAQAKIIPSILKTIENPGAETAILLADENLMIPVMHAVPDNVKEINVSMGVALSETKLSGLISLYTKMHKTDDKKAGIKTYDHKDISAMLKHPAVYKENARKILNRIAVNNQIAVPATELIEGQSELYKLLFTAIPKENAGDIFLANLLNILFLIFEREEGEELSAKQSLENEAIFLVYRKVKKLRELLQNRPETFSIAFTGQLLNKVLSDLSVPFKGKKATGLQILGVPETRNLDFENIIILGMNEGHFPKIQHKPGFLTQSIRFAFGMPLVQYQDAVYAYLFYRLLQRSKTISLVYNNLSSDEIGEKSRFIRQLEYESGYTIIEKQFYQETKLKKPDSIVIEKNFEILQKLETYNFNNPVSNKKTLSASALNTYLSCTLQFYFKYIAALREEDKTEEDISPALFGSVLHKAAEMMYSEILKTQQSGSITVQNLQEAKILCTKHTEAAIRDVFAESKRPMSLLEGKGQIVLQVLSKYLELIIKQDEQYAPFEIYRLESRKNNTASISIATQEGNKSLQFSGIIDRVDLKNHKYRIIDYKTGTVEKSFNDFESLFATENNYKYKAIIQMYLYGWIFASQTGYKNIELGIYDLKNMYASTFSVKISRKLKEKKSKDISVEGEYFNETLPEFLAEVKKYLIELFDSAIPFSQTHHSDNCSYCPYKSICMR